MKIALAHDYLNQYGGAERVLEKLAEMFPEAPIFTLLYHPENIPANSIIHQRKIITSFLQKIPLAKKYHRPFIFAAPSAIEELDLSDYDLVISSSANFAKGIVTRSNTVHLTYCHTPTRYLWDDSCRFAKNYRPFFLLRPLIPFLLNYLRLWDFQAAQRVDFFIANSKFVARRIKKYYQQESEIIYPPIRTSQYYSANSDNYFLAVGRLLPYKRFDLIIKAFNYLGWPIKIVGAGREEKRLRRMAKSNIEFLGKISDQQLIDVYAHSQALIFPQEEDFGMVAVEALASGKPVIAFGAGGALEIIENGKTGLFFKHQTEDSLIKTLKKFKETSFLSPQEIRQSVQKFNENIFEEKIKRIIENLTQNS